MPHLQSFIGANDNSPTWVMSSKPNSRERQSAQKKTVVQSTRKPVALDSILWLLPVGALIAGIVAWWMRIPSADLIWLASGLGAILLIAASLTQKAWRTRNFCVLVAIGAFAVSLLGVATQAGVLLFATDISVLISAVSITLAWTFKSRPGLMLSGFSGLLWLASLNPDISGSLGIGTPASQGWLPLFPLLLIAQGVLAKRLHSQSTLLVTIIAAYGFVISVSTSLPMLPLAGLFFAVSAAHHRMGKAWADTDVFGARHHIIVGWLAALSAALYVQSYWLNLENGQAEPLWTAHQGWWIALGCAAAVLFTSSIIRYKHAQISLSGIFLVSAAALILPVTTVRPDLVYILFDTFPGLPARPGFGFMIGAAIMASGLAWVVNGLRKGQVLEMVLGAAAVGLQALILFNPDWINVDFAIVFCLSLICALCVGGLIAGASLNHAPPPRRRA